MNALTFDRIEKEVLYDRTIRILELDEKRMDVSACISAHRILWLQ